jgi:hyperosmotically inducible periplasmic protein
MMKMSATGLFKKSFLVLTLLTASSFSYADAKQDILDARQETQIWTTYALSPYLRANDLKVSVHSGKATITGNVDEEVSKDLAKEIALGVNGIKEVDNQIKVQPDANPKRSTNYGETVDDITITAAVKSKLFWSKYSYLATKVETKNGNVSLSGTVDSKEARDVAGRLASNTRGVINVKNSIAIKDKEDDKSSAGTKAKNVAAETSEAVEDAWITAKVKSNFLYSSNVSGSAIDVSTNAGVVTLKGGVSSGAERALAVELAENIRGVKSVDAKGLTF